MRVFKNSLGLCLHMFAYITILFSLFLPFHKDYLTFFNFRKVGFDKQNVKKKLKHVLNNRFHSTKSTSSTMFDAWLLSEHVTSKNNSRQDKANLKQLPSSYTDVSVTLFTWIIVQVYHSQHLMPWEQEPGPIAALEQSNNIDTRYKSDYLYSRSGKFQSTKHLSTLHHHHFFSKIF